jgi:hypothetical protein
LLFDLLGILVANAAIAQERFGDFCGAFRLRRSGFRFGFAAAREVGGAVRDHSRSDGEVHEHFERFRLQRHRESDAHAVTGVDDARDHRLHSEMLFSLRRRNGEVEVQRIAGARLSAGR